VLVSGKIERHHSITGRIQDRIGIVQRLAVPEAGGLTGRSAAREKTPTRHREQQGVELEAHLRDQAVQSDEPRADSDRKPGARSWLRRKRILADRAEAERARFWRVHDAAR